MRRFIAYIAMALSMLLCVGVAFVPVFSHITSGREFTKGNEIVYKLSDKNGADTDLASDKDAANKVAEEMRNRLDAYKVEDYSVRVEGNDQVRVSFRAENENVYNHIASYLSFSGGDFSLATSGEKEVESRLVHDKIFKDSKAYVHRVEDVIPYVIFPISDTAELKTLIESLTPAEEKGNTESTIHVLREGENGEEEEPKNPDIFMWANWEEGDLFENYNKDPNINKKVFAQFIHDDIWFKEGLKEDEEPSSIMYLPTPDMTDKYDTSKLKQANEDAIWLVNMFNASKYEYAVDNMFTVESASYGNNTYANVEIKQNATAEQLIQGDKVLISATLISTLIAVVVVSLILVMFYRISALGVIANSVTSTFLAFLIFRFIGATMNIGAIIGGILIAIATTAIGILYCNKLKEEVYKGRSLRKSHQEAAKKIILPTIDVNVVASFAGLMIYFIAGNSFKSLGIVLFFGGIVSLVMTLLFFRINMWLLCNSHNMQENYKLLNLDEKAVPNIMKEEKSTYVAPYENKNFTAKKKPVAIVSLLLAVASVATIVTFGVINKSPLNVSANSAESTQLYVSIKKDTPNLSTEDGFKAKVLDNITLDGEKAVAYKNIDILDTATYSYKDEITTKYKYFVVSYNATFAENQKFYEKGDTEKSNAYESLDEIAAMLASKAEVEGTITPLDYIDASSKISHETVVTSNQGFVALACAIAIVGASLYFALRYRPSRGLAALVGTSLTTLITYGLFVMCRIQTTGLCSIIMPIATIISLVTFVFFFEKEKEMIKEQKVELDQEARNGIMIKATSYAAPPIFIVSIIASYIAINYFAFGNISFSLIFAGLLIAVILTALLATSLLGPTAQLFSKWFKGIKLPTIKIDRSKKQRIKMQAKPKTSEPEETVFIGIND